MVHRCEISVASLADFDAVPTFNEKQRVNLSNSHAEVDHRDERQKITRIRDWGLCYDRDRNNAVRQGTSLRCIAQLFNSPRRHPQSLIL